MKSKDTLNTWAAIATILALVIAVLALLRDVIDFRVLPNSSISGQTLVPSPTSTTDFPTTNRCSSKISTPTPSDSAVLNTINPTFRWSISDESNITNIFLNISPTDQGRYIRSYIMATQYSGPFLREGEFEHRFNSNLQTDTKYYWQIILTCKYDQEIEMGLSESLSFTTASYGDILPEPTFLSPSDGTSISGDTLDISWVPVEGAEGYYIRLDFEYKGSFLNKHTYLTRDTQYSLTELEPNQTYKVSISARNNYAVGRPSERSFITSSSP